MSTQRNGLFGHKRLESFRGDGGGPNWILIARGALLSTLFVRFGYKLKHRIDSKPRSKNVTANRRSNASSCERSNDCCCYCNPGESL